MYTLRLNQRGIIRLIQIGMIALLLAVLVTPSSQVHAQLTTPWVYLQSVHVTDDVTIRRAQDGGIIGDVIWQSDGIRPTVNEPMADALLSPVNAAPSTGAGGFTYTYTVNTPDQNRGTPSVKAKWQVYPQGLWDVTTTCSIQTELCTSGSTPYQKSWTNAFRVTMPNKVGKYNLAVKITGSYKGYTVNESITHTLYVLLHPPIPTPYQSNWATEKPLTTWLDYATTWAAGARTDATGFQTDAAVLAALNAKIYSNPLNWRYSGSSSGPALLSGSASNGNCVNLTEVLQILAATHGIPASSEVYRPAFLSPTVSERPPLSGRPVENKDGNARNTSNNQRDRWWTGLHAFLVYDGRYYEPTFGTSGTYVADNPDLGFGENVYCYITADGSCIKGSTLRARVSGYGPPYQFNTNNWIVGDYTLVTTP